MSVSKYSFQFVMNAVDSCIFICFDNCDINSLKRSCPSYTQYWQILRVPDGEIYTYIKKMIFLIIIQRDG